MRRKTCKLLVSTFAMAIAWTHANAYDLDWLERFSLGKDRETVLKELIPGTEDYFRFHTLHYQTTGQLDLAQAMLDRWAESPECQGSVFLTSFRDRQRLLAFSRSPDATYEYFRARLNVQLDHSPPATQLERRYPDTIPASLFDREQLIKQSILDNATLSDAALRFVGDRLLEEPSRTYHGVSAAWVLERLKDFAYPNLAKLVTQELQSRVPDTRTFGNYEAHRQLTMAELLQLRKDVPEIANSEAIVHEILTRLSPITNVDIRKDLLQQQRYHKSIHDFVTTLPSAFNTLKAHVLYRYLEHNLSLDIYDQDLFLQYLQLPRSSPIVFPMLLERAAGQVAQLSVDHSQLIRSPGIQDEEPLVRVYLERFLKDANDRSLFTGLLNDDYLTKVFAETKLLTGSDNPDRYYAMLDAATQRAVKDRVELQLTRLNPDFSDVQTPQTLSLDLKAVSKLIIRTYKINTSAYYRTRTEILNADVDLDGLIPSAETAYDYAHPSAVRHREKIVLPEIQGRGVWVVDLLGGGLRCRALIRRGDLHAVLNTHDSGHLLTILNESNDRVSNASVRLAGREFKTDSNGRVLIPFVENAQSAVAILSDGEISTPLKFEHLSEKFSLQAGMLFNRESLLPGNTAELILNPQLRNEGQNISLTRIEKGTVIVVAKDSNGVESTRRYEDLHFSDELDTIVTFRVPENCRMLSATLEAEVIQRATGQRVTLAASQSWPIATFSNTHQLNDVFLTRSQDHWIVEVRGRNGEPIVGVPVQFSFAMDCTTITPSALAQTNEQGQIQFLQNTNLRSVSVSLNGMTRSWDLKQEGASFPSQLYVTHDAPIRIAYTPTANDGAANAAKGEDGALVTNRFTLAEMRGSKRAVRMNDRVQMSDGFVRIDRLPAGDYELADLVEGRKCTISVAQSDVVDGYTIDTPWQAPVDKAESFSINQIRVENNKITIDVPGATSFTRVHVLGARYLPSKSSLQSLAREPSNRSMRSRLAPPNLFLSGMKLGEEYQYVLRRQSAKKFPGVMLPQPSLLLNPWVIDTAENELQVAEAGDQPMSAPMALDAIAAMKSEQGSSGEVASDESYSDYQFMSTPALLLSNLAVVDGKVEIEVNSLSQFPVISIIAVDPQQWVQRQVYQALPALSQVDLRLNRSFKSDVNLAQQRAIRFVDREKPIALADLGMGEMQVYRTIGELMPVLGNLNQDSRWPEFNILGKWNTLTEPEKLEAYTRLACHELHVFLFVKDRAFFDQSIKPYLANKKEKEFIDDFLLGEDLSKYLELWRYQRLNAAEKALLALSIPSAKSSIVRELEEIVLLQQVDLAMDRLRIESALAGKAIEVQLGQGLNRFGVEKLSELAVVNGAVDQIALADFAGAARQESQRKEAAGFSEQEDLRRARSMGRFDKKDAHNYYFRGLGDDFGNAIPFYQGLGLTKQWAESQWDRHRALEGSVGLISPNRFWRDLASAESLEKFRSDFVLDASQNRHASLMALAVLHLSMNNDYEVPREKDAILQPEKPILVVSRQTVELKEKSSAKNIMVGQSVTRADATDQPPTPSDPAVEESETASEAEYLVNVAYEAKITLTNLGKVKQTVDVLWQIPMGSIAIPSRTSGKTSASLDSMTLEVESFSTSTISYAFYFPAPGEFMQYPPCISKNNQVIARGETMGYHVVAQATQVDEQTWEYVAQHGDVEKIKAYLSKANLRKLDWTRIYHRLSDVAIYTAVLEVIESNHIPESIVFGYSIKHRDQPTFSKLLASNHAFAASVGPVLVSDLLRVDPIDRKLMEHLEFSPLVVPRIHPLREKLELTNPKLQAHYTGLLEALGYQSKIDPSSELAIVYFQLVNNRIAEAVQRFRAIDANLVTTRLQYDYLAACISLYQRDVATAREIAARYASYPIPRWRSRFDEIAAQVNDIQNLHQANQLVNQKSTEDGLKPDSGDLALMDRERRQREAAVTQASLKLKLEGEQVKIDHANADRAVVKLYAVDLELLFSKTPFVREGLERMAIAEPTSTAEVVFDSELGTSTVAIPEKYRNQTMLIEIESGAARDTVLYFGGQLSTYVAEAYGQLQVMHSVTRQPVPEAYVKVYARHENGEVRFFKDGYTDLRGRFDYSSISNQDLSTATRLAILVMDKEHGVTLHEVNKP